jgi:hypothetical protein
MPAPPIIANLRAMKDEDLIREHDEYVRKHSFVYTDVRYYLDELARRETDRQQKTMLTYTRQIKAMTIIVAAATILTLIITFVAMCYR